MTAAVLTVAGRPYLLRRASIRTGTLRRRDEDEAGSGIADLGTATRRLAKSVSRASESLDRVLRATVWRRSRRRFTMPRAMSFS
jgi:hypothetical protein